MKKHNWTKGFISGLVLSSSMALYAANFNQETGREVSDAGLSQTEREQSLQRLMSQIDTRLMSDQLDHEASLLKVLVSFNKGQLQQAMDDVEQLLQRAPDFHLAHLVKGDMLMSRFGTISDIGQNPFLSTLSQSDRDKLQLLRDEAHARLRGSVERQIGNKVPMQILNLAPSVKKAVLVEKSTNRLYVYERSSDELPPRLIHDYYISTGKKRGDKKVRGDLKTPEGVYFVTSWIPDEKLPSKYGVGAFPVNYPNEYDRRIGKTGSGIWLHGTDNGYYSRPPLDSEGCVVLTNIDLKSVMSEITPGVTPVVITEKASWLSVSDWIKQRKEVLTALEQWRKDWSSMDVERFLNHYDQNFWTSGGHNLKSWKARKRYIVRSKTYQRIKLSDISLLSYPESEGRPAMIVARFRQQYDSNNYKGDISKRIYLRKQGDQWRIMYEGA